MECQANISGTTFVVMFLYFYYICMCTQAHKGNYGSHKHAVMGSYKGAVMGLESQAISALVIMLFVTSLSKIM